MGFDARHKSDVFARDTAEVLQGLGINAILLDQHTPTPVVAFAVRHLGVDAGVMVTASHNPPADNGYKVYLGGDDGGSQIVPPADQMIHQAIMTSHDTTSATALARASDYQTIGEDVIAAYIEATTRVVAGRSTAGRESLRICYTPMHGVGASVFHRVLTNTGFTTVIDVAEQVKPNPDFPTVAFPNPEEPGALDLAMATAAREEADIIIAHDPDADRLAVAVPDGSGSGWHMLSGNEVGALLAWDITGHRSDPGGVLGCSLVSSPVLARIAKHRGYQSTVTPTGFKWISRLPDVVFGFEEALGYLVNPETVRDKDGISAGLLIAAIGAEQKTQGKSTHRRARQPSPHSGGLCVGTNFTAVRISRDCPRADGNGSSPPRSRFFRISRWTRLPTTSREQVAFRRQISCSLTSSVATASSCVPVAPNRNSRSILTHCVRTKRPQIKR